MRTKNISVRLNLMFYAAPQKIHSLPEVESTHVLGLCSLGLIMFVVDVLCVNPATDAHPVTDHPPLAQNIWITQCPGIVISARPPRCVNNTCLLFACKTRGRQSCEQWDVEFTFTPLLWMFLQVDRASTVRVINQCFQSKLNWLECWFQLNMLQMIPLHKGNPFIRRWH